MSCSNFQYFWNFYLCINFEWKFWFVSDLLCVVQSFPDMKLVVIWVNLHFNPLTLKLVFYRHISGFALQKCWLYYKCTHRAKGQLNSVQHHEAVPSFHLSSPITFSKTIIPKTNWESFFSFFCNEGNINIALASSTKNGPRPNFEWSNLVPFIPWYLNSWMSSEPAGLQRHLTYNFSFHFPHGFSLFVISLSCLCKELRMTDWEETWGTIINGNTAPSTYP